MRKKLWLSIITLLILTPISLKAETTKIENAISGTGSRDECDPYSYVCIYNLVGVRVTYYKDKQPYTSIDVYQNGLYNGNNANSWISGSDFVSKNGDGKETSNNAIMKNVQKQLKYNPKTGSYMRENKKGDSKTDGIFLSDLGVKNVSETFSSVKKQRVVYASILNKFKNKEKDNNVFIAKVFGYMGVGKKNTWTEDDVDKWFENEENWGDVIMVEPLYAMMIQDYWSAQNAKKNGKTNFVFNIGTATNVANEVVSYYDKCTSAGGNDCYRIYKSRKDRGHTSRLANAITMPFPYNGIQMAFSKPRGKIEMFEVADKTKGYGVGAYFLIGSKNKTVDPVCYEIKNNCEGNKTENTSLYDEVNSENPTDPNFCKRGYDSTKYTHSKYGKKMNLFSDNPYCDLYCTRDVTVIQPYGETLGSINGLTSIANDKNSLTYNTDFSIRIEGRMTCKFDSIYEYDFGGTSSEYWWGTTTTEERKARLAEIYKNGTSTYTHAEYVIAGFHYQFFDVWAKNASSACETEINGDNVKTIAESRLGQPSSSISGKPSSLQYDVTWASNTCEYYLGHAYNAKTQYDTVWKDIKNAYMQCANYNISENNKLLDIFSPVVTIDGDKEELVTSDKLNYINNGGIGLKDLKGMEAESMREAKCGNNASDYTPKYSALCLTRFYYRAGMNQRSPISVNIDASYILPTKKHFDLNKDDDSSKKTDVPETDEDRGYLDASTDVTDNNNFCSYDNNENENKNKVNITDQNGKEIQTDGSKIQIEFPLDGQNGVCKSFSEIEIAKSYGPSAACPPETYHAGTNVYYWAVTGLLHDKNVESKFLQGIKYIDAVKLVCNDENLEKAKGGYEDIFEPDEEDPSKIISITDCLAAGLSHDYCSANKKRYYCPNGKDITSTVFTIVKNNNYENNIDKALKEAEKKACDCKENFTYRVISLDEKSKAFPGKTATATGRTPGSNWNSDDLIKTVITDTKDIYKDKNNIMYKITLDSDAIRNIRDYNKKHKYNDFNLDCNVNGAACLSKYLREELRGNIEGKCFSVNQSDFYSSACMNNELYKID